MTETSSLREAIATEAARLLLRNKVSDYAAARIRASRWLSRRRVTRDEMPSRAEIEERLYVLAGLESAEHHEARLREARLVAIAVGERLVAFEPRFAGAIVDGPLPHGAEIVLLVDGNVATVTDRLEGLPAVDQLLAAESDVRFRWDRHPCVVLLDAEVDVDDDTIDLDGLRALVGPRTDFEDADPVDPAVAYELFAMLLERLDGVRLDPADHPEGDALYHTLQVFEHGRAERPWDEEFLLACLLHDVGWAIDPRHRVEAAVETLGELVTDRTLALVAELPRTIEALESGEVPRSLRRSEWFDDLLLLARCDRAGRVPGADVCTVAEALEYVAGLESAWD